MFWIIGVLSIWCFVVIKSDGFKKCGHVEYACKDSSCGLTDASYRGGYICDEFPFYAGGFPKFSVNIISGECITYLNNSSSKCIEWQTIEDDEDIKKPSSYDGDDFNNCKCLNMDIDNNYCNNWICIESKTPNWINLNNEEYNNCTCVSSSENGNYCSKWNCIQYDDEGKIDDVSNYYCTSDLPSSGNYCWSWEGNNKNNEEFEIESCQCLNDSNCNTWYCYKKTMSYWKSLFCLSVGLFGTIGLLIPLCFVTKLYCKKYCQYKCCSYYNNQRCNNNNMCSNNQIMTINNEGHEVYSNIPKTNNGDIIITDDGSKKEEDCKNQCNSNDSKQCESYKKCGYGSGNGNGQCGSSRCGSGCCCCPKFYFMLLFATIVTGGVGALIVNLCMWLFGFLLSGYLLKKYYCCYANCNNTSNSNNGGNSGNCRMRKWCSSNNSNGGNQCNKQNNCEKKISSNCEMKRCCSNSVSGGDNNNNYQELNKTDV